MAKRSGFHVELPAALRKFVEERVHSGRYHSASDGVGEGLRMLQAEEKHRDVLSEIRASIAEGIEDLKHGRTVDGEAVMRRWREEDAVLAS